MDVLGAKGRSTHEGERALRLTGAAVELRSFGPENLTDRYLEWLRDPRLMRFSNQRFRIHDMDTCRAYLASFANSSNLFIAIYHDGAFVGTMTAYRSVVHGTADIGLLIGSGFQGKGLGKDAWATLMAHLLATGSRKVTGGTLACNSAMLRIMQGCGMQADGVRARHEIFDDEPYDLVHFAKFA
jgi:RimJ/RimL family protein N-acetyltransferase